MANIGDKLLKPEADWKRFEDNDSMINYIGNWQKEQRSFYSGGTQMCYSKNNDNSGRITFSFYGSKIRIVEQVGTNHNGTNEKFIIDGIEHIVNTRLYGGAESPCVLVFEKTGLEKKVHTVTCIPSTDAITWAMSFDAIDIDSDGALLPELSRDYEFPIGIIDKEDLVELASEYINDEEQLLITRAGEMFLTDGKGSYTAITSEVDLTDYYTKTETYNKTEVDELIANVDAVDPNSHTHENISVVNGLGDTNGILSYKGKLVVNDTEYSYRTLPTFKNPNKRGTIEFFRNRGEA